MWVAAKPRLHLKVAGEEANLFQVEHVEENLALLTSLAKSLVKHTGLLVFEASALVVVLVVVMGDARWQ